MSTLPIKDMQGKEVGSYDFSDDLLEFEKGAHAVQEVVVSYLANQRQGSASTKTRSEVSGSNRKLWKQKGTGRARAGRSRPPHWRGGGVAFGPKPRNFRKVVNRKVLQLAFRRAFSDNVSSGAVTLVDKLDLQEAKTKQMASMLQAFGADRNALVIVAENDPKVLLASRNIPNTEVVLAEHANTYQMVRYTNIIIEKDAVTQIENRLQKNQKVA